MRIPRRHRPNIVLIVVDTLRADHLSVYGYGRSTSPSIERLAIQGVRFQSFFAQSNATHPSFTTLFTGWHPLAHGVVGQNGKHALDPSVPVLAEIFQTHGFRTAAVDNLERWFRRGFDVYQPYVYDQGATTALRTAEEVNALALPLLETLSGDSDPFFLFVHYWDPHSPYLPPTPYDRLFQPPAREGVAIASSPTLQAAFEFKPLERYLRGWIGDAPDIASVVMRYDQEIAYVDHSIGQLLTRLQSLGIDTDTLVVVTGDHGESLGEHDIYFDHRGLHDPQLRVPLVMRWPRHLPAGHVVREPARQIDLAPTLLDLAGIPDSTTCEGTSLRPQLEGTRGPATDMLLACESSWQSGLALRHADWKLIAKQIPDEYGPPVELYHLASDPHEVHNLADKQPRVVNELMAELEAAKAREMAFARRSQDPMLAEGVTLRPIYSSTGDDSLRERVIERLRQQGSIRSERQGGYTPEEDALIEDRLRNLGYL